MDKDMGSNLPLHFAVPKSQNTKPFSTKENTI